VRRWGPVVFWALVIFALSAVPGSQYPSVDVPNADKLVHVLVYLPLGALTASALLLRVPPTAGRRTRLKVLLLTTALCGLYGATDELHQMFVPNRSPDVRDVLADTLGGFLGGALALILRGRSYGRSHRQTVARQPPPPEETRTEQTRQE
jgi:VanZ family protein